MKNTLIILALILSPLGLFKTFGQNVDSFKIQKTNTSEISRTEVRVNALALLAGPAIDLSYEYMFSSSNGLGGSLLLNLNGDNYGSQKFALTPFYRFYFFDTRDYGARGLFVEGFSSFASVEPYAEFSEQTDGTFVERPKSNEFQWSLGFGAGRKWINHKGFSFEIFLGVGRYLLNTDGTDEVHARIGASFGKRF